MGTQLLEITNSAKKVTMPFYLQFVTQYCLGCEHRATIIEDIVLEQHRSEKTIFEDFNIFALRQEQSL